MLPPELKTQPNCSIFPSAVCTQQSTSSLSKSVPYLQPTFTRTSRHCLATFRAVNFLSSANNNTTFLIIWELCSVPSIRCQDSINNSDLLGHALAQLLADTVLEWDFWLHPTSWTAANRASARNVVVKRVITTESVHSTLQQSVWFSVHWTR